MKELSKGALLGLAFLFVLTAIIGAPKNGQPTKYRPSKTAPSSDNYDYSYTAPVTFQLDNTSSFAEENPTRTSFSEFLLSPKGLFTLLVLTVIAYALAGVYAAGALIIVIIIALTMKNPLLVVTLLGVVVVFALIAKLPKKQDGVSGTSGLKGDKTGLSADTATLAQQVDSLRLEVQTLNQQLGAPSKTPKLNDLLTVSSTGERTR